MTIAIAKDTYDALTEDTRLAIKKVSDSLMLGEPTEWEDSNGKRWYTFSDSRYSLTHVAVLASAFVPDNTEHMGKAPLNNVDRQLPKVVDRKGWNDEAKGLMQNNAPHPMTHPKDVSPSDPDAERPSFEDVRKAQEPNDGDLDDYLQAFSQVPDTWSRVEEEL